MVTIRGIRLWPAAREGKIPIAIRIFVCICRLLSLLGDPSAVGILHPGQQCNCVHYLLDKNKKKSDNKIKKNKQTCVRKRLLYKFYRQLYEQLTKSIQIMIYIFIAIFFLCHSLSISKLFLINSISISVEM